MRCESLSQHLRLFFPPQSIVIMSPPSPQENILSNNQKHCPDPPTPTPTAPATPVEHANNSERPRKHSPTAIPTRRNHASKAPASAALQSYLRSDEPAERRVKDGVRKSQRQNSSPAAELRDEPNTDHGAMALEEWMAQVTAHPEQAIWFRDIDKILPPVTALRGLLPQDEGGLPSTYHPYNTESPDSMQPMFFCPCCTPDLNSRRS